MSDSKRKPKIVTAATIELTIEFVNETAYWAFAGEQFGRKAETITDRRWVSAQFTHGGGVRATFQFTHTCKNGGAHRSDSERFVRTTCNSAGLTFGDEVRLLAPPALLGRIPIPTPAPGPVVDLYQRASQIA